MSFLKEVAEAGKKMLDSLAYMATQGVDTTLVTPDEANNRMEICKACPKLSKITHQCSECGCFMKVKTKLLFDPVESVKQAQKVTTTCPDGKW